MVFQLDAAKAPPCGDVPLASHLVLLLQVLPVSNVAEAHCTTTTPSRGAMAPPKAALLHAQDRAPPNPSRPSGAQLLPPPRVKQSLLRRFLLAPDRRRPSRPCDGDRPLPRRGARAVLPHARLLPCPLAWTSPAQPTASAGTPPTPLHLPLAVRGAGQPGLSEVVSEVPTIWCAVS